MRLTSAALRSLTAALAAAMLLAVLAPMAPRQGPAPVKVRAAEQTGAVDGTRDFDVSPESTHIAIHWTGHPDAVVTASFSKDGRAFSDPTPVEIDEDGGADGDPETYGSLIGVDGVRTVRVHTDRPLAKLSVLALDAAGPAPAPLGLGAVADGATTIPNIITRAQWGADETIRFDLAGDEFWPREYAPLQKLVVHHTAGRNDDPDPAATVRAIYYYHAVTRRWADIGYNYLIDEQGRIYEGRYARDFWNGEAPSADNPAGLTVAGGHAQYYNQGSMGIALLGTFTTRAPSAAARASLVKLLAWAAARNGIDPFGASTYVNPKTGASITTNNIGGHRDYANTDCPGSVLYAQLPAIRSEVAAQMNLWPGQTFNPQRRLSFAAGSYTGRTFSSTGMPIAAKSFTLTGSSSAPTNQAASIPSQAGTWFAVTGGVWAGYWIKAAAGISLGAAPPTPTLVPFETARPLRIPAGTYVGHRFSSYGTVTASKSFTLSHASSGWTTKKSTIPGQPGSWWYISAGVWDGYWIRDAVGMSLGPPPPPLPTPIAIFSPPRTLVLAPGTYTGRLFSAYGIPAGSYTYTLTKFSSAPTSRYSTLPGQTGNWYYIIDGVWETFWIKESAGTTLAPP